MTNISTVTMEKEWYLYKHFNSEHSVYRHTHLYIPFFMPVFCLTITLHQGKLRVQYLVQGFFSLGAGDLLNSEQPAGSPEPQLPLNKSNTAAVWCSVKVFISRQNIGKKSRPVGQL